jgi:phosphoribosylformylglycinamidine synthase
MAQEAGVPIISLGHSTVAEKLCILYHSYIDKEVLRVDELMAIWRETSHRLRALQIDSRCARAEKRNTGNNWEGTTVFHLPHYDPMTEFVFPVTKIADRIPVALIREEGTNGDQEMAAALHLAGFLVRDVAMSDLLASRSNLNDFRGVVFPGGFSFADALGSAKGWAGKILFNQQVAAMFREFRERSDTWSLGVCNGCQLMAQIGWVPFVDLEYESQPVFTHNLSRKFESRWSTVTILDSPAIMLRNMAGAILGIWVAHGEGRIYFPNRSIKSRVIKEALAPIRFVDDWGDITLRYPLNPNGSPQGITALCSSDGRHLAMMPHPERAIMMWQWPWVPEVLRELEYSPWLRMFQNAYQWCKKNQ